ncbi:DUF642 domain-containing protein [Streptomyces sp. HUAS TT7]|uniref:DUF642 domain-containing protein n=1 Tax=Streptomyces sp. HUAS TT7 TaxID=3447507 RepID=UPI003F65CEE9
MGAVDLRAGRRRMLGVAVAACGAVAVTLVLAPQALAEAFAGGGFESPSLMPGQCRTVHAGEQLEAWAVTAGDVRVCDTAVLNAAEGRQSVQLVGEGTIRQSFDTVPGQKYAVSFALAGDPAEPRTVKDVLVTASPGGARDFSVDPAGNAPQDVGWENQTYRFTARTVTTWLEFSNNTFDYTPDKPAGFAEHGPLLDNVQLTPVSG